MKQPNVLLLDLQPSSELGSGLRGILESALKSYGQTGKHQDISLREEVSASRDLQTGAGTGINDLISRLKPAVVFLISPREVLRYVKAFFQLPRRDPPARGDSAVASLLEREGASHRAPADERVARARA